MHHDRVVPVDLCMAKEGGEGHSLHVVRQWQWGLVRLEGQDMGIGIMWWRGRGLIEVPVCGVKRVSVTLVRKGTKKEEKK